jgi:hypothetical protein
MLKKNKKINSLSKVSGWTEMRLFNTKAFIGILKSCGVKANSLRLADWYQAALDRGYPKTFVNNILDSCAKPIFKENFLWKFFYKLFNIDLRIPYLFGAWTLDPVKRNTITSVGKKVSADQTGGTTTTPVTAIAIGVGTPSTTALGSESTTNGGARGAATVSNQTTDTTGDTERWIKTFTFTGSLALTEEGLFDNNTSGGKMLASQSFAEVAVVDTDTLQITHNVKYA